ncbi:MAG: M48 family metallopeptidase [Candidatus Omnitrophica bacterium]|nr:M48 family metallopeptidase [Candidatus Omnitrophota bacterium]MBU4477664.1 M48 family metallopeptidase [Candidatus Omnitrophota bacterium]
MTVCVFLLSGCATVPITGRKQISFIPSADLLALSIDNYRQLLAKSILSPDAKTVRQVRTVGGRIARAAEDFLRENGMARELGYYAWEFNLIKDDKTVNAFCMPGGKVAVYTGILIYTENENGLAVVIAHEVAHAIANHGAERMSQMLLAQFGTAALAEALKAKDEKTQQYLLLAFGIGTNVGIVLPYSRLHEKEADHIGLILMARAGYNPETAVAFWHRMNEHAEARPPEFLSTHPAPETRIQAIRAALPEAMRYYKPAGD